jgi:hypothetical protein
MAISVDQALDKLLPLIQQRKLIVLAGSGISVDSGLPSWDDLLKDFITFCEELQPYIEPGFRFPTLIEDAKRERVRKQYPIPVATALKQALKKVKDHGTTDVGQAFDDWFRDEMEGEPNDYHRAIVATDYPFMLTTNYDRLLEAAADELGYRNLVYSSYSFTEFGKLAKALFKRRPSIIHIHGDVRRVSFEEIVFTAEDYQKVERDHYEFRLALHSLFLDHSTLLIGYGASDPHLEGIFEELSHYLGWTHDPELPWCYLVTHNEKGGAVHDKYKEGMRTQVIGVDDFDESLKLLETIQSAFPREVDTDASTEPILYNA